MSGPDIHEGQLYCEAELEGGAVCTGLLLIGENYTGWRSMYAEGHVVTRPDGIRMVMLDPATTGNDDVNTEENDNVLDDHLYCSQCNAHYPYQMIGASV